MEGSCTRTIALDYLWDGSGAKQCLFSDLITVNVSIHVILRLIICPTLF